MIDAIRQQTARYYLSSCKSYREFLNYNTERNLRNLVVGAVELGVQFQTNGRCDRFDYCNNQFAIDHGNDYLKLILNS